MTALAQSFDRVKKDDFDAAAGIEEFVDLEDAHVKFEKFSKFVKFIKFFKIMLDELYNF